MLTENKHLPLRDWFAVAAISSILMTLAAVSYFSKGSKLDVEVNTLHHLFEPEPIQIEVFGAIERPGLYTLAKGDAVRDMLEKVQLLSDADLDKIKFGSKLKQHQKIYIPFKSKVLFFMEGAVKHPGLIELPRGHTLENLLKMDLFEENADLKYLKKKRRIKDLETIIIKYNNFID